MPDDLRRPAGQSLIKAAIDDGTGLQGIASVQQQQCRVRGGDCQIRFSVAVKIVYGDRLNRRWRNAVGRQNRFAGMQRKISAAVAREKRDRPVAMRDGQIRSRTAHKLAGHHRNRFRTTRGIPRGCSK